ncbi:MAG: J domain-containing protein [Phycisphaerae bacterium]|nr:J domain-containing protein [Phycisphaerae bacterium]
MPNPYEVLNVAFGDGDEVIREQYLEAVRRFPPERHPQEFRRVREAYDCIKDEKSRLEFLLFEPSQGETIDELLAEEQCPKSAKRVGLTSLLKLLNDETK